jgi:hypothetical protein
MKKTTIAIMMFLILGASLNAAESNWYPVRQILEGLRQVSDTMESIMAVIDASGIQPGQYATIPASSGLTTSSLKIKFSETDGTYRYMLEVWALVGGEYVKGIEFRYIDENNGQMIIRPWLFNNVAYPDSGHYVRATYNHGDGIRTMVIDVVQTAASSPQAARYLVSSENGIVHVYFTAHTRNNGGGESPNDAYVFGALISETSPFNAAAKYGLADIGDEYDFMIFGEANSDNAGFFNQSGFVADGSEQRDGYPDPAALVASELPTAAVVSAIAIDFASTEGPGF